MKLSGSTALVTGASAGIGKAFATELARRGADLIVTARREDRLEELARTLRREHGREVHVLAQDLAERDAPARLADDIAARGLTVDVLVNNAGYGVPGLFLRHPWSIHADFLQVMVTSVVQLTHLLLPRMITRGSGHVINVASVAGLLPSGPSHTLYGAAKSFLIKFSESLSVEVGPQGVTVTAVCPGFTFSEFHDVNATREMIGKRIPKWLWMDADVVARQGLDAALRGDPVYVNGIANRAFVSFWRSWPEGYAAALMKRNARRILSQIDA